MVDGNQGNQHFQHFQQCLACAVPLWIDYIFATEGIPTNDRIKQAHQTAADMLFRSDSVLRGDAPKGWLTEWFNALAESLAVMAFEPGGIEAFELQWEVKNRDRIG